MRLDTFRRPSFGPLAWTLVALQWVFSYVIWTVPHEWGQTMYTSYYVVLVPVLIFATLVALAQRRWILGTVALVAIAAPFLVLLLGFALFGFSHPQPVTD